MFDAKKTIGEVIILDSGEFGEIVHKEKLYIAPASGCRMPQWKGWTYHLLTFENKVVTFSESF